MTKKNKLQEKINKKTIDKQKKVIVTMHENRAKDTVYLRYIIDEKAKMVTKEIEKGTILIKEKQTQIQQLQKEIQGLNIQLYRLQGAKFIINDILTPANKKQKFKQKE